MGACNNSSVAQLVESRTHKPKCTGSNHGVDNRLVDLAFSMQNRGQNWVNGKRERGERE